MLPSLSCHPWLHSPPREASAYIRADVQLAHPRSTRLQPPFGYLRNLGVQPWWIVGGRTQRRSSCSPLSSGLFEKAILGSWIPVTWSSNRGIGCRLDIPLAHGLPMGKVDGEGSGWDPLKSWASVKGSGSLDLRAGLHMRALYFWVLECVHLELPLTEVCFVHFSLLFIPSVLSLFNICWTLPGPSSGDTKENEVSSFRGLTGFSKF